MKKQAKKLKLAKETVRGLQVGAMGQVAGASDYTNITCMFFSCIRFCLDEPIGPPGP
jgi:mannose/fructose/N-acetylgalactosamine-specific phosphotransferase system component IID